MWLRDRIALALTSGLQGCLVLTTLTPFTSARADVVISSGTTRNISCSAGICTPSAKSAVLNIGDVESSLASGNLTITTTGGGVEATDIRIDTALTWSSASTLSLDAYESVVVNRPIAISGVGGLSITTNNGSSGGLFLIGAKARVNFSYLSSSLTINNAPYALENSVAAMASAIAANPSGDYALANDFDASGDGTYQNSPIPNQFGGNFEGLGHIISGLSLYGTGNVNNPVGLFAELGTNNQPAGLVENIGLAKLNVSGNGYAVGGLIGLNLGTVSNSFVSGAADSELRGGTVMGLLVGGNFGSIALSGARGAVTTGKAHSNVGGLTGANAGSITRSYANCNVSVGKESAAGGLVGINDNSISQSYAMNNVQDNETRSNIGGLIGSNTAASEVGQTYSTTAVNGDGRKGGLIGFDRSSAGSNTSDYWDMDTSNITDPQQGAGHPHRDPGITGLSTAELQSGLPKGFHASVWSEDAKINGGFPYLIANPPR
jgi:hypothetical protein